MRRTRKILFGFWRHSLENHIKNVYSFENFLFWDRLFSDENLIPIIFLYEWFGFFSKLHKTYWRRFNYTSMDWDSVFLGAVAYLW